MKTVSIVLATLLALTFSVSPLADKIYRVVDEHGNVVYTDSPRDRPAEAVQLPSINTQPPVKPSQQRQTQQRTAPRQENYSIQILSPQDGKHVPPGQRDVAVVASTSPNLRQGHQLQLIHNGQPFGEPTQGNSFQIQEIFRGVHTLEVVALDSSGEIISRSQPVSIFVHRPTVNN